MQVTYLAYPNPQVLNWKVKFNTAITNFILYFKRLVSKTSTSVSDLYLVLLAVLYVAATV